MNKVLDSYKDKETAKKLVNSLFLLKDIKINIMEVCGTHTMAISRFGIRKIIPDNIRLISGPGCPVCVTPDYYIKSAIELAKRKDFVLTTFGDMMRIPYKGASLLREKAMGADIRIVYSPLDTLDIAEQNKNKKVVFLSVGFETTVPTVALAIIEACRRKIDNFYILSANKTIPEALRVLANDKEIMLNGFIYPGHVSAVIGIGFYENLKTELGMNGVVAGFEPLDIIGAVYVLAKNISSGNVKLENLYNRVVRPEGNKKALEIIDEVFKPCDAFWRGIGCIKNSGLALKDKYLKFDAWKAFELTQFFEEENNSECRCGDILKGKCTPFECPLFDKVCTPQNPVGSCMVSSEGTCAAYYRYNKE